MINPSAINTGAIGSVNLFYNKLFTGVKGSPSDLFISVVMPLPQKRIGFAFNFGQEKIGFSTLYNGYASYAYTLPLDENMALHLGGSLGIINQGLDRSAIDVVSPSDPIYQSLQNGRSETKFDLKISGTLQIKALLLGFSTGRLTQPKYPLDYQGTANSYPLKNISNVFFSTKLQLSNGFTMQPVASVSLYDWKNRNVQFGMNFIAKDVAWVGIHNSGNKNISLHVGAWVKKLAKVGYAYSMPVSSDAKLLGSGHEIFASITFNKASEDRKPLLHDRFVLGGDADPDDGEEDPDKDETVVDKDVKWTDTVSVSSLEDIKKLKGTADTSMLRIPPVAKSWPTPGYYVVVGVFRSENNVNSQIKQLLDRGIDSYKFYHPENGYYYAYILRSDRQDEADKLVWDGKIDVSGIWVKHIPAK